MKNKYDLGTGGSICNDSSSYKKVGDKMNISCFATAKSRSRSKSLAPELDPVDQDVKR